MAVKNRGERVNLYTLVNGVPVPWDGVITFDNTSIQIGPYSSVTSGSTTVTTAGTRVQLSGVSTACKFVTVTNPITNTGVLYVGGSTISSSNGQEILPGSTRGFPVDNLQDLYVDASVNSSAVKFNYFT